MLKKLFGSKEEFFVTIDGTAAQTAPEPVSVKAAVSEAKSEPKEASTIKPPVESVAPVPVSAEPITEVPTPVATTAPSVSVSGFATTYLKPGTETLSRRRPSTNMTNFLGMARDMKRR